MARPTLRRVLGPSLRTSPAVVVMGYPGASSEGNTTMSNTRHEIKRMWFVMVVDCEVHRDINGSPVETPIADPHVLGSTSDPTVARRALAQLQHDAQQGGRSMVRSTVEPLGVAITAAECTEVESADAAAAALLAMVGS